MTGKPVMAQELPAQKETLETIVKVNDYFMKKYADYTLPSFYGRVRPSNIWTRGVYYEGLMALYGIYPREDYYKYAYDWADFHKWGMRNGNTTRNADDHCCGQVYIDLYNMCPSDPNMIRNIKASIDMVVNTPQVNDWWWIDAIQMAMPILKIAYGGAIRTLILLTKNRMEKIATGVVEMAGYMQLLYRYWMKSLPMKHIARTI